MKSEGISRANTSSRESRSSGHTGAGKTRSTQNAGAHATAAAGEGAAGAAGGGLSVGGKDAGSYVVARHVADFGNVVVGFTKKKAFRVVNTGKVRDARIPRSI